MLNFENLYREQITWLGEPAGHNLALTGGKAAQISRLAAAHPVPPGFCLTTIALKAATMADFSLDGQNTARLPTTIRDALARAYQMLADCCGVAEPSVAVRSSAIDEDGQAASFAGQHETYLNVTGVDAVEAAALHCWASRHSERALAYCQRQGLAAEKGGLAVLIQQLIMADVSAVVFSANPVSGKRDEIVMNASWGLGESIVGGTVNPDTYIVAKADLAIISRRVAAKRRMTVPTEGGTHEVKVPRFLQKQPALSDSQAIEMAQLALTLETEMGWPVDIECAYQDDKLYLLQCRPITTLKA